jgi:oligogalacturonide lyase
MKIYTEMNAKLFLLAFLSVFITACREPTTPVIETGGISPMPDEWIDQDTDHRVVRLTGPEGNSRSFYFHNNPFIPEVNNEGDLMVYYGDYPGATNDQVFSDRGNRQLYTINLKTFEKKQVTDRPSRFFGEIVGKTRREVFYQSGDSVFSTHVDNLETNLIYVFPDSIRGHITTVNADETLLAGVASGKEKSELLRQFPRKGDFFTRIFEAKLPHSLFTIEVETGELRTFFSDTAWLNHVQFSPTDPELLMFCHEGPWHLLDRIWTININNPQPVLMHERTVHREIAGHEFFSRDGRTIWFDLQIPRGETFYLAGLDLSTGVEKRYAMKRDEWSIHFNISPDQQLFAGDGGDSSQVAHAEDGMWLYLFRPGTDSLSSEKLVNMKNHDYRLEPNVHFSPDGKWIIFRANFEGSTQVYAVSLAVSNTG